MKVRLMTFHTPKNYGAVLQAFSLMSYLKTLYDDVKVIDYNTPALRAKYPLRAKSTNLKRTVINLLLLPSEKKRKSKFEKFDKFVNENMDLTERYESLSELVSALPAADIAFTGSDQVFNPSRIEEERKAFYLDFFPDNVKKVSYAASFGVSTIPKDKEAEITGYLKKFNNISVREESGKKIVENLITDSAEVVLDPVFLNDKEFWTNSAKPYSKEFENYLLYYRLLGTAGSDEAAKRIAKQKGLELVTVNCTFCKTPIGSVLWDVGPQEFLYLYKNADFIVTDSFHGVAFSAIFEKQFVFTDTHPVTKERGYNLLTNLEIQDKAYIENYSLDKAIDYKETSEILAKQIANSQNFIKKI